MKISFLLALMFLANICGAEPLAKTLMIQLAVTDDHYVLQDSWLLDGSFPATVDSQNHEGLRWTLLDDTSKVVAEGWIADPQKVSGAFVPDEAKGNGEFHHLGEHRVPSTVVIIRAPYDDKITTLTVERQLPITLNNQQASSAQAAPVPPIKNAFKLKPRIVKQGE